MAVLDSVSPASPPDRHSGGRLSSLLYKLLLRPKRRSTAEGLLRHTHPFPPCIQPCLTWLFLTPSYQRCIQYLLSAAYLSVCLSVYLPRYFFVSGPRPASTCSVCFPFHHPVHPPIAETHTDSTALPRFVPRLHSHHLLPAYHSSIPPLNFVPPVCRHPRDTALLRLRFVYDHLYQLPPVSTSALDAVTQPLFLGPSLPTQLNFFYSSQFLLPSAPQHRSHAHRFTHAEDGGHHQQQWPPVGELYTSCFRFGMACARADERPQRPGRRGIVAT